MSMSTRSRVNENYQSFARFVVLVYLSSTRCISVFSGQMKVVAINQLMQMSRNNLLTSGWTSNQLSFSYHTQLLGPFWSLFTLIFIKCESKIKFQGCKLQSKPTKAKSEPDLITMDNQVLFLLHISDQFKLISYIELNSIGPKPIP